MESSCQCAALHQQAMKNARFPLLYTEAEHFQRAEFDATEK